MYCLLSNDSEKIFIEAIDQHFTSSTDYIEDNAGLDTFYLNNIQTAYCRYKYEKRVYKPKNRINRLVKISDIFTVNPECISRLKAKVITDIIIHQSMQKRKCKKQN